MVHVMNTGHINKRSCNVSNEITHASALPSSYALTFWRRIFFQVLAHPVFKM